MTIVYPRRIVANKGEQIDPAECHALPFTLTSNDISKPEIILDYGRAERGRPFFEVASAGSTVGNILFEAVYSEQFGAISDKGGDGPYFLFSNAMDTYRNVLHEVKPSSSTHTVVARHEQCSQRYQRIRLLTPNTSITFLSVGFWSAKSEKASPSLFRCSDPKLNKIWEQGVRTIEMCTVQKNETLPAWDVTADGTTIHGSHWAPCRQGTRWTDICVRFDVRIDRRGASWGIHMVANGLVFCLDKERRTLTAHEGLSHESSVFPSVARGDWLIDGKVLEPEWLSIRMFAEGAQVLVLINDVEVATVSDLDLHPLLGGSANNSGSIAFGGPSGWTSTLRNLTVTDLDAATLYSNSFLPVDKERTFADFAVGTNPLPCMIDGAKRDRAVFGGDLHISGRAAAFSSANLEAVRGSIELLTSHQTKDGYLGNLCPIQAPKHTTDDEPPTYAFYSLTYALLLMVAVKDYWLFSGDETIVGEIWQKAKNLIAFAERFQDDRLLVAAPPPLSCMYFQSSNPFAVTFFPLSGPVLGVSTEINLAFYDALKAMAAMSPSDKEKQESETKADVLKQAIIQHLWDEESGILHMSDTSSPTGLCAHVNAYGLSLDIKPPHTEDKENLVQPSSKLPLAFRGLEPRFDSAGLCSPYSAAFAVEACFSQNDGLGALSLLDRVWGPMTDETHPNFSGGLWEAMNAEGEPLHKDTSLMHAWSSSPVYLLPMYLAGVEPTKPGWEEWKTSPVYAELDEVEAVVETPAGLLQIRWIFKTDEEDRGFVFVDVPKGTVGVISPPKGWLIGNGDWTCGYSETGIVVESGTIRLLLRREC
ncbi:Six-hairpin glycosidase [Aureobasidium namibiae CBS 147.97]|uniref:Six-hairpin glycosidase n=1 Tax=Aureobasidium namibiae CBS 147.97 TaxID=1043004 RepID=A0A074X501_9PEZI|nr:Six-hairpin glycosidase [Aureobasidium namibiae CBS 147.97]KEQ69641.1 Six-hairpin glycosidase [Aureobasidium namibiae CBS 147.97]